MANHPNRSQQPRRVYLLQGVIGVIDVMHEAPAHLSEQLGHVWRSGPTVNNRPGPLSMLTDDVEQLLNHMRGLGHGINEWRQRLRDAPIGSRWNLDGTQEH